MSTAIIRDEEDTSFLVYCKHDSYPAGLGFDLLSLMEHIVKTKAYSEFLPFFRDNDRFEFVNDVPKDIQYEYVIQKDGNVHCQECWFTPDVSYHGGGFRHGGTYNLKELREKIRLQQEYTYRRPEAWEGI